MKDKLNKLMPFKEGLTKAEAKDSVTTDLSTVPRITNETVAEHREEVLKGARKFIYPLQQSKHRIVIITSSIIVVAVLAFMSYCVLGLYKLKQDNAFLYRVTQVIPFPIARTGGTFISYENYLFELRHFKHYYETQLQENFTSPEDRLQLEEFRRQALNGVIDNAYIKALAKSNGVTVNDEEVNERIEMVKAQNRLGSNSRVFEDVLKDYWGWSVRDFQRSLREEILEEKVVAKLDPAANTRAQAALVQLKNGANFGELAKQISEDPTAKNGGGEYGIRIDKANRDIPPQVVNALFKMKVGDVSDVINTGRTLEIVRLNSIEGDRVTASHIIFILKDITGPINDLKDQQKVRTYVTL